MSLQGQLQQMQLCVKMLRTSNLCLAVEGSYSCSSSSRLLPAGCPHCCCFFGELCGEVELPVAQPGWDCWVCWPVFCSLSCFLISLSCLALIALGLVGSAPSPITTQNYMLCIKIIDLCRSFWARLEYYAANLHQSKSGLSNEQMSC